MKNATAENETQKDIASVAAMGAIVRIFQKKSVVSVCSAITIKSVNLCDRLKKTAATRNASQPAFATNLQKNADNSSAKKLANQPVMTSCAILDMHLMASASI